MLFLAGSCMLSLNSRLIVGITSVMRFGFNESCFLCFFAWYVAIQRVKQIRSRNRGRKLWSRKGWLVIPKEASLYTHLYSFCDATNLPLVWLFCRQELVLLDNEIAFNEAVIEEREQGIQEIHTQIGEVNEIFKDLAVLVNDQGVMIGKGIYIDSIRTSPLIQ